MTIQQQIAALDAKLEAMRQKIIDEKRNYPTKAERERSRELIAEIEELEKLPATENIIKPDPEAKYNRSTTKMENEFKSDGEFFQAVARASVPNGTMDSRLESRAASGMGISVPSEGGFIVSEDFSQTV